MHCRCHCVLTILTEISVVCVCFMPGWTVWGVLKVTVSKVLLRDLVHDFSGDCLKRKEFLIAMMKCQIRASWLCLSF